MYAQVHGIYLYRSIRSMYVGSAYERFCKISVFVEYFGVTIKLSLFLIMYRCIDQDNLDLGTSWR
jgi:hypothetical protein